MDRHNRNSVRLSIVCLFLFAVILIACDIAGVEDLAGLMSPGGVMPEQTGRIYGLLSLEMYLLNVPAWVLLYQMYRLLRSLKPGEVFTPGNIRRLRIISLCCAAAALLALAGSFFFLPLLILAVAAAFMMLLVRIIQNCFQQAAAMKDELDLTV